MKYASVEDGHEIQIGDLITADGGFGKSKHLVHRVTKKYAFVKYNDVAEGKFPRVYDSFWFCSLPKQKWQTTTYKVFKPLNEAV